MNATQLRIGEGAVLVLPRGPRRVSRGGLSLYHPMTLSRRVGWEVARAAAALGLARLLPAREVSPPVREQVERLVGGSESIAIIHGRRPDRCAVLIMTGSGRPTGLAKIALTEAACDKLEMEADALDRFGARLLGPVRAPTIIGRQRGCLLFEPVEWVPRSRAHQLPVDLAYGLGELHSSSVQSTGRCLVHGDFAPWNVFRTRMGWTIIDWEEARLDLRGFHDPLHYLIQSHTHLGSPGVHDLVELVNLRGRLYPALDAFSKAAKLDLRQLPVGLRDYLEASIATIDESDHANLPHLPKLRLIRERCAEPGGSSPHARREGEL